MEYPQYDYAVIGGDMRQVYLAGELAHHQNRVCRDGLMAAPDERRCSDASVVNAVSDLREAVLGSPSTHSVPFRSVKTGVISARMHRKAACIWMHCSLLELRLPFLFRLYLRNLLKMRRWKRAFLFMI